MYYYLCTIYSCLLLPVKGAGKEERPTALECSFRMGEGWETGCLPGRTSPAKPFPVDFTVPQCATRNTYICRRSYGPCLVHTNCTGEKRSSSSFNSAKQMHGLDSPPFPTKIDGTKITSWTAIGATLAPSERSPSLGDGTAEGVSGLN